MAKKTLTITLEYPPQIGGISTFIHQLVNALPHDKSVVLAPHMADEKEWDATVLYKVIRANLFFPVFIWPRWVKLFFIARKIVKQEGIELIMVHHCLPVGYVAFLLKKFLGVPFLVFSHGTDVLANTRSSWKKDMSRMVLRQCEQLLFNSESLKQRLLEKLPEFANKSTVVYPCPDADFFSPANQAEVELLRHQLALEGKQVVLSIARLDEGKGFPHLVKIMPEVLKRVPNLVWIVIGNGPKRDSIYEDIRKHSLQNVVRYMGDVPHKDIKKYYYLAEVFALFTHPEPDGREEGLGLVFLEAAACGKPVIAGKSGGVEEAVIHGQTGLVVDVYGDLAGAGQAIVDLIKQPELAKQLGKAAQDRIKGQFVWERQLKVLEKWLS